MRKVKFPFELDARPFVTDDLAAKITPTTSKILALDKERDERRKVRRRAKGITPSEPSAEAPAQGAAMSDDDERKLRADEDQQVGDTVDEHLRGDVGCNTSALYELVGIVTHKGAAADAGHYISWVRKDAAESKSQSLDAPPTTEWFKVRAHAYAPAHTSSTTTK